MDLIINFKNRQTVELHLINNDGGSDVLTVPLDPALGNKRHSEGKNLVPKSGVDIHFDTVLVSSIDKILKKNRIETSSLKTVKVRGQVDQSSVAYHVALAVAAALESKV